MTFLELLDYLREFNMASTCVRLLVALVLGGAIGFERGRRGRAAGFRTHILVCVGAAMTTMTGHYVVEILQYSTDPLRIGAQVISGIGFLGVGTILVTGKMQVRGLTTAAGLWSTAAVGLAVGIGYYEAAIICSILLFFTIVLLHKLDNLFFANAADIDIYIEIDDIKNTNKIIAKITEQGYKIHNIEITAPQSKTETAVGIKATIDATKRAHRREIIAEISSIEGVILIVETV